MIGIKVSKKELKTRKKKGILDYRENRIINPNELYTPDKSTTLDWKILAEIKERSGVNGDILLRGYFNSFKIMLAELIDASPKGSFVDSIEEGCWHLLNVGGIEVYVGQGSDPHGRNAPILENRFPMIKEDAEEYGKHFFKNATYPVYASQVKSVTNRNWWNK